MNGREAGAARGISGLLFPNRFSMKRRRHRASLFWPLERGPKLCGRHHKKNVALLVGRGSFIDGSCLRFHRSLPTKENPSARPEEPAPVRFFFRSVCLIHLILFMAHFFASNWESKKNNFIISLIAQF
jgi:hypothetical protein